MPLSEELTNQAKDLGLTVTETTTEDDLKNLIDEKKKELDSKDDDKDVKYWREEAKKAFESRDELKKERRKLSEDIKALKDQISSLPPSDDVNSLKKELEDLKKFKEEEEKRKEEEAFKTKSESEIEAIRLKKQLDELAGKISSIEEEGKKRVKEKEEELQKREEEIAKLRTSTLEVEIVNIAATLNAFNPKQVFKLLKDDFSYDATLGKYTKIVRDSRGKIVDELSVDEAVKKFLEDTDNQNLIKSTVKPGMNSTKITEQSRSDDSDDSDIKGSKYDPKDPDVIKAADYKGLSVQDHIRTLILRDKKMESIKAKRQGK